MDFNNMHRRGVMAGIVALGFAPSLARAKGVAPVVATASGKVEGFLAENGVASYLGVPYGASTGGANRFMPPKPVTAWAGVRETVKYGPSAPQPPINPGPKLPDAPTTQAPRDVPPESEDCLVLNVWTPAPKAGAKKAVMVWLHGGGFSSGSGSGATTNGTNLAHARDVVIVSINHRLNIFGYTYLGGVGGAEFADSGNVGQLDIIQALTWVRDNIASFGGDPSRVTIFGQSGGGKKVSTMLGMPGGEGLFHRAIAESGAGMFMAEIADQDRAAQEVMKELGIAKDDMKALQAVSPANLVKAYNAVNSRFSAAGPWGQSAAIFQPTVDGRSLPHHPFDPAAPVFSAKVPLVIGYTHTESLWFRHDPLDMTDADLLPRLKPIVGEGAEAIITAYRGALPKASAWDLMTLITSDFPLAGFSREIARRKNAAGPAPAYLYRVDWETPVGHLRAPHTIEVPFIFENTEARHALLGNGADLVPLSHLMSLMWTNFAKTGKPEAAGWPVWPAYNGDTRPTMMINSVPKLVNDPDKALRIADDKAIGKWKVG